MNKEDLALANSILEKRVHNLEGLLKTRIDDAKRERSKVKALQATIDQLAQDHERTARMVQQLIGKLHE